MKNSQLTISIYVTTSNSHFNGNVQWKYFDITDYSRSEFYSELQDAFPDENSPEFIYSSFEGPESLEKLIDEYGISSLFWDLKDQILNDDFILENIEAFDAYVDIFGISEIDNFQDRYYGHIDAYNLAEAFGEQIADEIDLLHDVPNHLRYYFDFESYGRDLLINDYTDLNGHIFRNY